MNKEDVLKSLDHDIEILQSLRRHIEQKRRVGSKTAWRVKRVAVMVSGLLDHEFNEEKRRRQKLGIPKIPDHEIDKLINDIIAEEEDKHKK
jgi:aromatic ring-opening dioxygenase catalytic subunit (LigB family)